MSKKTDADVRRAWVKAIDAKMEALAEDLRTNDRKRADMDADDGVDPEAEDRWGKLKDMKREIEAQE
ncbi:hypothetical protein AAG607_12035 [Citromicrobium bathyomarinum]|uniref:hypothetical protein n=1 Tax=Citromicrobium bathyomarinum TaxID=72174 RepID=UPI003159AEE9